MHIFKKVSSLLMISLASVSVALADAVPVTCPLPKDILTPPTTDSRDHSVSKLVCVDGNCVWQQINRFGTDFHWHFYIHAQDKVSKDTVSLNSQIKEVLNSLTYASGPIEEQPYAYVCRYSNKLNFNALAIYTKEVKCPSPSDLAAQQAKGQTSCDWMGNCNFTLNDRFDSDFTWNFAMNLRAWSESDGANTVNNILPRLMYGEGSRSTNSMGNPSKNRNLYTCSYHTSDGYTAQATFASDEK